MNKLFDRWLPCATLATWSVILITFWSTGRIRDFLAPEFRPGVLIAGVILGLMALVFLFSNVDAACCATANCGHSLSRRPSGRVLTFAILLLPITVAATFSPEGYSSNVVKNRGVIMDATQLGLGPRKAQEPLQLPLPTKDPTALPGSDVEANSATPPAPSADQQPPAPGDYLTRTPEGFIVAEVLDLLYAAQDNALRKDFEGKAVQLVGQLMPDTSGTGTVHRFKVVRMFMTCCAADARPVATLVEAAEKPAAAEMTWVKITGTSTFPIENGRRIAVVKADKVEATSPPEESMLY
ncbi:MAG: Membrane protein-like protein [Chthoniobacter sp.]|jgi:uncharacterized repeat protein (TIGR03943 family)|nr:Membrane protein-like protein [Chthoniobacter sp.]